MIKNIGFENFRRFRKFPKIDLGDVTILVGGNNSGKSTLVKALLLCVDNLKMMRVNDIGNDKTSAPTFRFDGIELHDTKVKTFARAIFTIWGNTDMENYLYGDYPEENFPSTITFQLALGQFEIEMVVGGLRSNEATNGYLTKISILDSQFNLKYELNYETNEKIIYIDFEKTKTLDEFIDFILSFDNVDDIMDTKTRIKERLIKTIVKSSKQFNDTELEFVKFVDSYAYFNEIDKETKKKNGEVSLKMDITSGKFNISNPFQVDTSSSELVAESVISSFSSASNFYTEVERLKKDDKEHEESELTLEEKKELESNRMQLLFAKNIADRSYLRFRAMLSQLDVRYISAHAAHQNSLYSTNDRNDYLAKVIHEFYRENIAPKDVEYELVRKWMRIFEIGVNFYIHSLVPGEAYNLLIEEPTGSVLSSLADKGMGSIQLMILLIRLATILHQGRHRTFPTTVLIEEPEQNLHPKMQSLLADLFAEFAMTGKIQFIIETHSEYLVRKSQVLVAKADYKDEEDMNKNNPFKVYYLPSGDEEPYEMKYNLSGRFSNKFGEGFFDEAGQLNLITLRKEKEVK